MARYLVDMNFTKAAAATHRTKNPDVIGPRVAARPRVRAAIDAALAARMERVEVKADDVLRELLRMGLSDPAMAFDERGALKSVHEIPVDLRRAISSIETDELFDGHGKDRAVVGVTRKIKFWPKDRALELLGKHLKLFVERHSLENPDGSPLVEGDALVRMAALVAAGAR